MELYPGSFEDHILYNYKYPENEYDEKGIPYGIQIDYDNPFYDSLGEKRSIYLYRPSSLLAGILVRSLVVLQDNNDLGSIEKFMLESDLVNQAEKERCLLIFPVPSEQGWNSEKKDNLSDDLDFLNEVFKAASMWYLFPGRENPHAYMMGLIGAEKGAEMAHLFLCEHPQYISSLLTFGGNITMEMLNSQEGMVGMSVWMVNTTGDGYKYWIHANQLENTPGTQIGFTTEIINPDNNAKQLRITKNKNSYIDSGIIQRFWHEVFSQNFKIPDAGQGRVYSISGMLSKYNPCIHIRDKTLSDNNGLEHNWYEFIPEYVQKNRSDRNYKCPLIISMHGGGSSPETACGIFKWHELGAKEGFITVYPNASSDNSWNNMLYDFRPSDVSFLTKLIQYLIERYPVDPSRVYISGFSNGSSMAHVMAACRPDIIAGVVAFNTRFPVHDGVYSAAKEMKKKYDYRMPVYSSYGTKDFEYPPQEGSGQFTQMRFWKWFNNIEQKELSGDDKSGAGVPGDEIIHWGRLVRNDERAFTTHKYFSLDKKPIDYYNYTIVKDLPHTVEQGLITESWNFVERFSRNINGSLEIRL